MSASDSHRAEVRAKVKSLLTQMVEPPAEHLELLTHDIMALLDSERERWIGEVRQWVKYNKHDMGELGEFIRTRYVYNKLDELDAVSKVLDEL